MAGLERSEDARRRIADKMSADFAKLNAAMEAEKAAHLLVEEELAQLRKTTINPLVNQLFFEKVF